MIELTDSKKIRICNKYYELGFKNAINKCYIQPETKERLLAAAKHLPRGYKFLIWDAYRPFALQKELFYAYREDIIKEFDLSNKTVAEQLKVINKYVALPKRDKVPVHTTGCAVDLTIIDARGKELAMGSDFDEFSDKTSTHYYDNSNEGEIQGNRIMLYDIMTSNGFVNLPSEWWHFSYGDQYWANKTGMSPLYTKIEELVGTSKED